MRLVSMMLAILFHIGLGYVFWIYTKTNIVLGGAQGQQSALVVASISLITTEHEMEKDMSHDTSSFVDQEPAQHLVNTDRRHTSPATDKLSSDMQPHDMALAIIATNTVHSGFKVALAEKNIKKNLDREKGEARNQISNNKENTDSEKKPRTSDVNLPEKESNITSEHSVSVGSAQAKTTVKSNLKSGSTSSTVAEKKVKYPPKSKQQAGSRQKATVGPSQTAQHTNATRSAGFNSPSDKAQIMASIKGFIQQCYPQISRRRGEEGKALVSIVISNGGKVTDVRLIESTGFTRLDNCALSAVEKATLHKQFVSALQRGKATQGEIRLKPIWFRLR